MTALKKTLAQGSRLKHRLVDELMDRALSLQTLGRIEPFELDIDPQALSASNAYQATPYLLLREIFSWLGTHCAATSFFDIGCGKGRVLYMAHKAGYRRVIGLDLSDDMCLAARFNLSKKGVENAQIFQGNAEDHSFPSEPCVFYMNNPFKGEAMRNTARHLYETAHPESVIALVNPLRGHMLSSVGFKEIHEIASFNHNYRTLIYSK